MAGYSDYAQFFTTPDNRKFSRNELFFNNGVISTPDGTLYTNSGNGNLALFDKNSGTGLFDNMNMKDWFNVGTSAASATSDLYGAYMGYKNYQLGKDMFKENRAMNRANFFNQAQTVNADMADRQRVRNSMGMGMNTKDYMNTYGVKDRY